MRLVISRRLLVLTGTFLTMFPIPPTVSLVFDLYQCHYFISNLSFHVLRSPHSPSSVEDAGILLERILARVDRAAGHQKHLQPLVLALVSDQEPIQHYLNHDSEIS